MKTVSVISAVMNRNERLDGALDNWLAAEGVAEVVLVDWSSSAPVKDKIGARLLIDPRLRLIRVNKEPAWILSHALNLAASHARQPWLAKLDIDYRISPDFFSGFELSGSSFVRGNWALMKDREDIHLNGFIMIKKRVFFDVNGYNENIRTYGYEDTDLYERLVASGLSSIDLFPLGIEHVPHDDGLRIGNQSGVDKAVSNRKNKEIAGFNKHWMRRKWRTLSVAGNTNFDSIRYTEFESLPELGQYGIHAEQPQI